MKPCICGSTNVTIVQTTHATTNEPVYQPFCQSCQLLGSPQPSRIQAINKWDDRPLIDQLIKLVEDKTYHLPNFPTPEYANVREYDRAYERKLDELIAKIKGETE
jgi:hypothetical protein